MLHFLALAVAAVAQEEQCDAATLKDQLFVAHWSHVPKAGGTAFADLAKRIVCAKNARFGPGETTMGFEKLNPCCVPNFCADARTCMATATTCPLVLGIGRHETSMSRLVDIPCCAQEWYSGTVASFLMYALKPSNPDHPTDAELAAAGVDRAGDVMTLRPVDEMDCTARATTIAARLSRPDVGSSRKRIAGFAASSTAMVRRLRCSKLSASPSPSAPIWRSRTSSSSSTETIWSTNWRVLAACFGSRRSVAEKSVAS
mmetsp:Transcript_9661/g.29300  ORF Transcript_9661/g.29300 Transcript_9661/m.29300 type:complete len:258 (-) Transcript_9661:2603-3376(-)